jgi:hypothetical protein
MTQVAYAQITVHQISEKLSSYRIGCMTQNTTILLICSQYVFNTYRVEWKFIRITLQTGHFVRDSDFEGHLGIMIIH